MVESLKLLALASAPAPYPETPLISPIWSVHHTRVPLMCVLKNILLKKISQKMPQKDIYLTIFGVENSKKLVSKGAL